MLAGRQSTVERRGSEIRNRRVSTMMADLIRPTDLLQMASDAELWNSVSHQAHGALGYEETARLVLYKRDLG